MTAAGLRAWHRRPIPDTIATDQPALVSYVAMVIEDLPRLAQLDDPGGWVVDDSDVRVAMFAWQMPAHDERGVPIDFGYVEPWRAGDPFPPWATFIMITVSAPVSRR